MTKKQGTFLFKDCSPMSTNSGKAVFIEPHKQCHQVRKMFQWETETETLVSC